MKSAVELACAYLFGDEFHTSYYFLVITLFLLRCHDDGHFLPSEPQFVIFRPTCPWPKHMLAEVSFLAICPQSAPVFGDFTKGFNEIFSIERLKLAKGR